MPVKLMISSWIIFKIKAIQRQPSVPIRSVEKSVMNKTAFTPFTLKADAVNVPVNDKRTKREPTIGVQRLCVHVVAIWSILRTNVRPANVVLSRRSWWRWSMTKVIPIKANAMKRAKSWTKSMVRAKRRNFRMMTKFWKFWMKNEFDRFFWIWILFQEIQNQFENEFWLKLVNFWIESFKRYYAGIDKHRQTLIDF